MNTDICINALKALYPNIGFSFAGEISSNDDLQNVQVVQSIDERGNAVYAPPSCTWDEFLAQYNTEKPIYYFALLREERDRRIAETDWWVLADRTPTDEQLAYRQALRDLPANTTDPENPVWPTKPE